MIQERRSIASSRGRPRRLELLAELDHAVVHLADALDGGGEEGEEVRTTRRRAVKSLEPTAEPPGSLAPPATPRMLKAFFVQ